MADLTKNLEEKQREFDQAKAAYLSKQKEFQADKDMFTQALNTYNEKAVLFNSEKDLYISAKSALDNAKAELYILNQNQSK